MSENLFTPTITEKNDISAASNSLATRQAQEVQAAMVIAKKFPRDEFAAYEKIKTACKRKKLAESATYTYPRGGTKVTGPSIRLAEALASSWGNIDYGIIELEQNDKYSSVMAYAWDLETNTRQSKIFTVPHVRYSTKKGNEKLTDPRDIYEMVANNGARRVRACILGVIPGDVVDDAVDMCSETLEKNLDGPIEDVTKKMLAAFKDKFGITKEMIEEYLGYSAESFTAQDIVKLKGVYSSLKDGMTKREDFFKLAADKNNKDANKTKGKNILEPEKTESENLQNGMPELADEDLPDFMKEEPEND